MVPYLPSDSTIFHYWMLTLFRMAQPVLSLAVLKQKGHWGEIKEPSPASTHNRLCDSGVFLCQINGDNDIWTKCAPAQTHTVLCQGYILDKEVCVLHKL